MGRKKILKRLMTVVLSILSTSGVLGCTSAVDFDDIKTHLSEHKVAYGVGGTVAVASVASVLCYIIGSSREDLSFEEDDDDLDDISFNFVKN